jgi:hypothetical protein
MTVEPKIPGAIIPRRVFTHGVIPGSAILRLGESALE